MSAARARRVLLAAIAVSLLLHLIFAGYFRWPFRGANEQIEPIRVRVMRIARLPAHTPPPTPVPTPIATPAVHASIAPPKLAQHAGKGPPRRSVSSVQPTAAPIATATPAPVATATSAGACVSENAQPSVQSTPDVPELPASARVTKTNGVAAIHVALDAQGRVTDATIEQSSGDAGFDAIAMQMARDATYSPRYDGCKPVAGEFTFTVQFAHL